ncbi:hypothetical protein JHK82_024888 [Glycine max]|nr:hypothetical protein JHK86_025005 [Glycine max]KAG5133700.1 hypothetical protein JHK82_024888 [Glycine max]
MESAQAKNQALKEVGVVVPTSFKAFEDEIMETFHKLVEEGNITPIKEFVPPPILEDLNTTIRSGKVHAPTHIISTISDDRGEEPCYVGVPMSTIIENGYGVGDVIYLLWLKCRVPRYCLLTIGPQFGSSIDDVAHYFKDAYDRSVTTYEFVESMKNKGICVPGIGHK